MKSWKSTIGVKDCNVKNKHIFNKTEFFVSMLLSGQKYFFVILPSLLIAKNNCLVS